MAPLSPRRSVFLAAFAGSAVIAAANNGRRLSTVCSTATLGKNCDDSLEKICVLGGANVPECWDSCDQSHEIDSWRVVAGTDDRNAELRLLITEIQAGRNLAVTCASTGKKTEASASDWCPLGTRCGGTKQRGLFGSSGNTAAVRRIKEDQGMCVLDARGPHSRNCWDMCDTKKRPQDYPTIGTTVDVAGLVSEVRSNECPRFHWWPIILIILLLCLCCCAAAFLYQRYGHKLPRRTRGGFRRNEPVYEEPLVEVPPPVMEPPPQYQPQPEPVYQREEQPPPQVTYPGRIAGLDEPHLFMPNVQPPLTPQTRAQVVDTRIIGQAPSQPAVQMATPTGPSYRTMAMLPQQPTALSQSAMMPSMQTQPQGAFATQPLYSQPGSMQVQQGPYYR